MRAGAGEELLICFGALTLSGPRKSSPVKPRDVAT
jgi:hypothetical protein